MDNFLDRYMFPGGYLPSVHRLLDAINVGSKGSLEIETVQSIGPHYVKTLRSWREGFERNWGAIREDFEGRREGKVDGKSSEAEVEAWRRRCELHFRLFFWTLLFCLRGLNVLVSLQAERVGVVLRMGMFASLDYVCWNLFRSSYLLGGWFLLPFFMCKFQISLFHFSNDSQL
jgi:hypothetical protein